MERAEKNRSKYSKNIMRNVSKLTPGYILGALGFYLTHEPGHALVAKLAGADPRIEIENFGIKMYDASNTLSGDDLKSALVSAGGPLANYAAAFTAALLARRVSKEKHPKTKAGLIGFSLFNAMIPTARCIYEIVNGDGDFYHIIQYNPYLSYVLPPLSLAAAFGISYYALKDFVKK